MSSPELEADVKRLVDALLVLTSDVKLAANLSQVADTQFARRTYVRAVFAQIEGNINLMADVVVEAEKRGEITLTTQDIELLLEERRSTDGAGTVVRRPKFVPVRDRMTPAMELFASTYGASFKPDKSTTGWERFLRAMELRNRITHPKNASSFDIADSDLDDVRAAREWFATTVESLLDACS